VVHSPDQEYVGLWRPASNSLGTMTLQFLEVARDMTLQHGKVAAVLSVACHTPCMQQEASSDDC